MTWEAGQAEPVALERHAAAAPLDSGEPQLGPWRPKISELEPGRQISRIRALDGLCRLALALRVLTAIEITHARDACARRGRRRSRALIDVAALGRGRTGTHPSPAMTATSAAIVAMSAEGSGTGERLGCGILGAW
jgi:hypothetical protein